MRIFVAGGTGAIGSRVVRTLMARGYELWATTKTSSKADELESMGVRALLVNALESGRISEAVKAARPEVVINQMTALAEPRQDYGSWLRDTNALRGRAGVELAIAAREVGCRRVIAQSACFMTAPIDRRAPTGWRRRDADERDRRLALPLDETAPVYEHAPDPLLGHVRANLALERAVLQGRGPEGVVLRYGFIYGPGTAYAPGSDVFEQVARGEFPIVGDGLGRYPFVHVDDAANAAVAMVTAHSAGVYNVVDDDPAPQRRWVTYLADLLEAPAPPRVSREEAAVSMGPQAVYYNDDLPAASNARIKKSGFRFAHRSWKVGFRSMLGAGAAGETEAHAAVSPNQEDGVGATTRDRFAGNS